MDFEKIKTSTGTVWVNPHNIAWFWDHGGKLCVKFVGETEMQTFDGVTAEEFERLLNPMF